MTPPSFSAGDLIAGVMAVCAVATLIFSEIRKIRAKAAHDGGADAAITVKVEGLDALLKGQMAALTALVDRVHEHEVNDASFHGEIRTEMGAVKEQLRSVDGKLDQLGAQIKNLTPTADTFTELLPRRRKSAAD